MIKKITIAAVLCASAAYFIYPDVIEVPGESSAWQTHAGNMPAPLRAVATKHYDQDQPTLDDDGTEIVLGVRVRKDRNCRVELKDYVTTAADAAALLGKRLIRKDTGRSYQLLIRAAALDGGKVEHIAWLADQAFGAVSINDEPQVANLKHQYELAALATKLGEDPGKTRYLKNKLVEIGVDEDQLGSLDKRADALLQSMRNIQRTVLGEVTIAEQREQGDA